MPQSPSKISVGCILASPKTTPRGRIRGALLLRARGPVSDGQPMRGDPTEVLFRPVVPWWLDIGSPPFEIANRNCITRPHCRQLIDRDDVLPVVVERVVRALPARTEHPGPEHRGAQSAVVTDAAIQHPVAAGRVLLATEALGRPVIVGVMQ